MNRRRIGIIALLVLAFIWIQSVLSMVSSAGESSRITEDIINPLLRWFGLSGVHDRMVRKVAHVIEYMVLSIFVAIFWEGNAVRACYTGFTIAFLDESIQVLSGRGALITDVWVDMIGVAIGTGVGYVIWAKRAEKRAANKEQDKRE